MTYADNINITAALRERMLNSPFSETIKKLFSAPGFIEIWRALSDQGSLREDHRAHDANEIAYTIIHVACTPPQFFFQSINWTEENRTHIGIAKSIQNLQTKLTDISLKALQTKADMKTNFSNTGHLLNMEHFLTDLQSRLNFLEEMCEQTPPPKSKHQPTKLSAKRVISTARASIIKAEILKRYTRPHHKEIADLINAIDDLDEPFTEADVAKLHS